MPLKSSLTLAYFHHGLKFKRLELRSGLITGFVYHPNLQPCISTGNTQRARGGLALFTKSDLMNATANAVAQPTNPGGTPLYRARIARPLGKPFARPNRLGYSTVAWCERHDLIAVVSGCGGVSVFHADSPGEYTMLVSQKQAPARHVVWRPAANGRRPVLVVVDAAGRITFWVSDYDRVNVWKVEYSVEVDASVVGIGWTKGGGAVAAVLSNGSLSVWLYLRGRAFGRYR